MANYKTFSVNLSEKNEILDLLITDLHTSYLPTANLPPLDVDEDKAGVASDHDIIIFAPAQISKQAIKREKKNVSMRPLPLSSIMECGKSFASQTWEDIFDTTDVNEKVNIFHKILRTKLETFFPCKNVKLSSFDKKWFTPELKILHRNKQREFFKNRQ